MKKVDDKHLRSIGHKLKPVVTVAAKGLTDAVMLEIERALNDHELIKVKVAVGDRTARAAVADEICARSGAALIQSVGGIVLLLRRNPKPNPNLSNLQRHQF